MRYFRLLCVLGLLPGFCLIVSGGVCAQATPPVQSTADTAEEDPYAANREQAKVAIEELIDAYLNNDWDALSEKAVRIRRHQRFLDREQRADVAYIQKNMKAFRPKWWSKCASTSNVSFKAGIWNRPLMANYMPTMDLGAQHVIPEGEMRKDRTGQYVPHIRKLNVIVTWKPTLVDSEKPAKGRLAESHGFRLGDVSEVIVWHELGHCYITNYLPLDHVVEFYQNYRELFSHLQEFYADLTSLYHSSPKARRIVLMLRLAGLDNYDKHEQHDRAAHAIGALVLHTIMRDPDKWPSFHFPPEVPKQQVELNTIIYLYEHMDVKWSLDEARALRELANDFISEYGEKTLRARGVAPLPGDLKFALLSGMDDDYQDERDEWVAARLKELIESGRADKLKDGEVYDPPIRIYKPNQDKHSFPPEALRIEIPF